MCVCVEVYSKHLTQIKCFHLHNVPGITHSNLAAVSTDAEQVGVGAAVAVDETLPESVLVYLTLTRCTRQGRASVLVGWVVNSLFFILNVCIC